VDIQLLHHQQQRGTAQSLTLAAELETADTQHLPLIIQDQAQGFQEHVQHLDIHHVSLQIPHNLVHVIIRIWGHITILQIAVLLVHQMQAQLVEPLLAHVALT